MSAFQLRPATADDRDFAYALHRQTFRAYVEQTWGYWDEQEQQNQFEAKFNTAISRVVELDGAPIGWLVVKHYETHVFLDYIALLPDYQRRGFGEQLVRQVIAEAGDKPVELRVLKVNPARRLYERLGFVVVADLDYKYLLRRPVP